MVIVSDCDIVVINSLYLLLIFFIDLVNLCIYPTPPPQEGFVARSIFERSTTELNLEFSFLTGCRTKDKEPTLPYYLLVAGDERGIYASPKGIRKK